MPIDLTAQYLGAASALFLSVLVLTAIVRQRTTRKFQKKVLLVSALLLVSAIVSSILISIYIRGPALEAAAASDDQEGIKAATILAKRVQATLDFLFAITIGAFIVVTTNPGLNDRRGFWRFLVKEFPNSYLFYVFIMGVGLVSVLMTSATVTFPSWQPGQPSTDPTIIEFPLWFQFVMATAVAAIVVYAPAKLIDHLNRTRPSPTIVRDTYLIILGINGFAIGELLFEVILPGRPFALDLRILGFVIELGLVGIIAFAIREKGFLHELLVPQAEAELKTAPTFRLDRGLTYVVTELKPVHSFAVFKDLVTHGAQGLCITRTPPKTVVQQHGLEKTPILWLSRVANHKNCIRPSPPETIAMAVEHFVSVGQDSVVLLDGLEYLISHNDFPSILALLHDLNETVSLNDAILLIPLDPRALGEREFALIRRDLRLLLPSEGAEELLPAAEVQVHERRRT